jgi:hypothetical protein
MAKILDKIGTIVMNGEKCCDFSLGETYRHDSFGPSRIAAWGPSQIDLCTPSVYTANKVQTK